MCSAHLKDRPSHTPAPAVAHLPALVPSQATPALIYAMQLSQSLLLLAAAAYAAAIADPAAMATPQRRNPATRTQRQVNLGNQQRVRPGRGLNNNLLAVAGGGNVDPNNAGPLGVLGTQTVDRFTTCTQRFTFERCLSAFVSRVSVLQQNNVQQNNVQPNNVQPNNVQPGAVQPNVAPAN